MVFMEVQFSPEVQARLEQLDRRYDEVKSGKVKPLSDEEVEAHFRAKSAARRPQL
jgi:hypothetical protein